MEKRYGRLADEGNGSWWKMRLRSMRWMSAVWNVRRRRGTGF